MPTVGIAPEANLMIANNMCTAESGCDQLVIALKLCWKHYQRLRRHGDPLLGARHPKRERLRNLRPTIWDRLWAKVEEVSSGCWEWQGAKDGGGYGNIYFRGKDIKVHRLAYRLLVGPIGNLHVCHHCDNPPCVRPDHLFVGTVADNMQDRERKGRGRWQNSNYKKVTHCKRNHLYDDDNTYITPGGKRHCRICTRLRHQVYAAAKIIAN